jgi:hypothetical protein
LPFKNLFVTIEILFIAVHKCDSCSKTSSLLFENVLAIKNLCRHSKTSLSPFKNLITIEKCLRCHSKMSHCCSKTSLPLKNLSQLSLTYNMNGHYSKSSSSPFKTSFQSFMAIQNPTNFDSGSFFPLCAASHPPYPTYPSSIILPIAHSWRKS